MTFRPGERATSADLEPGWYWAEYYGPMEIVEVKFVGPRCFVYRSGRGGTYFPHELRFWQKIPEMVDLTDVKEEIPDESTDAEAPV